jgi:hypothetical protein
VNGLPIVFIKALMISANWMEDIFNQRLVYDEKNIRQQNKITN